MDAEKSRKDQTLLGSLLRQEVNRKVDAPVASAPLPSPRPCAELDVSPFHQRIKDQMMAILIGGKVRGTKPSTRRVGEAEHRQDPTTITVVWALYELARKPHIVEELREQIRST